MAGRIDRLPEGSLLFLALKKVKLTRCSASILSYVGKHLKTADNLREVERRWFENWCLENCLAEGIDKETWTFQASLNQVEAAGINRTTWLTNVEKLENVGFMARVHNGGKGHATLWIVMPSETVQKSRESCTSNTVQEHCEGVRERENGVQDQHESSTAAMLETIPTSNTSNTLKYLTSHDECGDGSHNEPPRPLCPECRKQLVSDDSDRWFCEGPAGHGLIPKQFIVYG